MSSQRLRQHAQGLHGSAQGPLCVCYGSQFRVFLGFLREGMNVSLILFILFITFFN